MTDSARALQVREAILEVALAVPDDEPVRWYAKRCFRFGLVAGLTL